MPPAKRPPFNPTKPAQPTASYCPVSDDGQHVSDPEDRSRCPACGYVKGGVQSSNKPLVRDDAPLSPPITASVAAPPVPEPLRPAPISRTGRKAGAVGLLKFPKPAVAAVAGLSPAYLRSQLKRGGVEFTPDEAGVRAFVEFMAPRMGFVRVPGTGGKP